MSAERLIPYCVHDVERRAGLLAATKLLCSGEYAEVKVVRRKPEGDRQFVRIYVRRKEQVAS